MPIFNVTFEIVTDESAENGDAQERGFVAENISLRDAIDGLSASSNSCELASIEADCWPISRDNPPRWITYQYGRDWQSGEFESRSIHFPRGITGSSAIRIAKLLGAMRP
jgi:hypothetical protein